MLVTSIFSFFHNVFYALQDRNYHLCYIYFVVCKCFEFGQSQIFVVWEWVNSLFANAFKLITSKFLLFGKGLTLYLTKNPILTQIVNNCRRYNISTVVRFVFERRENIVGRKGKMLVSSIFSFTQNVFKSIFLWIINPFPNDKFKTLPKRVFR